MPQIVTPRTGFRGADLTRHHGSRDMPTSHRMPDAMADAAWGPLRASARDSQSDDRIVQSNCTLCRAPVKINVPDRETFVGNSDSSAEDLSKM
jgi:hypothetical protein